MVWEDAMAAQTVITADELTRFYLSEEGFLASLVVCWLG